MSLHVSLVPGMNRNMSNLTCSLEHGTGNKPHLQGHKGGARSWDVGAGGAVQDKAAGGGVKPPRSWEEMGWGPLYIPEVVPASLAMPRHQE